MSVELTWNGDKINKEIENGISRGFVRTANLLKSEIVTKIPVDTGHLRASVQSAVKYHECTVTTNVEYAHSVEFGTVHQLAQPTFRPALKENEKKINNIFDTEIGKAL